EPFISIVDLSETLTVSEESRRYLSENLQPEWFAGVIFIRARLLHKAVATGISLVQRLAGKNVTPPHFVFTEAEARALAAQLRAQRSGGTPLPPSPPGVG
ncbi:MAG TPA: hypothetical protein VEZ71_31570, partial [Archangium sp.]|nr:hypothetical protein [Archangium sp.]